jgi:hypothetical protein
MVNRRKQGSILASIMIALAALAVSGPAVVGSDISTEEGIMEAESTSLTVDFLGNITRGLLANDGALVTKIGASSPDGKHFLEIPEGTRVIGKNGEIVTLIRITETRMPPLEGPQIALSQAYTFETPGITFSQDAFITLSYNAEPEFKNFASTYPAFYDPDSGWVPLENTGSVIAEYGRVTVPIRSFATFAVIAQRTPASFKLSNLNIVALSERTWGRVPFIIKRGDSAQVTVDVENHGGMAGEYSAVLRLNGKEYEAQKIELEAGQSEKVTFTLTKLENGKNSVEIDGLSADFDRFIWINWLLISGLALAFLVIVYVVTMYLYIKHKAVTLK